MIGRKLIALIAATGMAGVAAAADTISADYLIGTWSLDGASACGQPDLEHVVFDRDGGFRSYRRGQLEAAGFWHLETNDLAFHVVSSAARLNPELAEYVGYYSMAEIDTLPTKVERDRFELVVRVGPRMNHWKLDRCKK